LQNVRPMTRLAPPVETVDAGRVRAITRRDVGSGRPGVQAPEDAVQNEPVIELLTPPHLRRQKRFDHQPLEIRQVKPRHLNLQG
jgi:hypothetical protein